MGWKLENDQLVYKNNGICYYPSAEEIFNLFTEGSRKDKVNIKKDLYSPDQDLNIQYSRRGAKLQLEINYIQELQAIVVSVKVLKGKNSYQIRYINDTLPDSVVIENVWYNLLNNYDDTLKVLQSADIHGSGPISLLQYIQIIKLTHRYDSVLLRNNAVEGLSTHPVKDMDADKPPGLHANLYPYQNQGYQWMRFIIDKECGCILGDEMGLGKTLQIIALIVDRRQDGHTPTLIIAPVSLLENWKREFNKFTVGLKIYVHHGVRRTGMYMDLLMYDVVLISYNTACSDQSMLRMINWDMVVVDEAQNIKNWNTLRTKSIKNIPRRTAIAVTGTPFENHITDLWSLMDFVAPDCFGKVSEFQSYYSDDIEGAKMLEPILTPIMIRRKVEDVAQDLPKRIDIPQVLQLSENEEIAYEQVREKIIQDFDGRNAALPMLQKLRMYCTHPGLLCEEKIKDPVISSKYQRLCELLEEIVALNEKVILFTSYNKMFEILEEDIVKRFGIPVLAINGSTPPDQRQTIIDKFSTISGTALLILNPRAAGTGLNITAASRVIHYNLEWNPALEDQASARAYRRGQTKTVFVYRLYYKDTVEDIINERIEKKREMFGAAVIGVDGSSNNSEDIIRALMISPGGKKNGEQTQSYY